MTAVSAQFGDLADPAFSLPPGNLQLLCESGPAALLIETPSAPARIARLDATTGPPAVVLPLDHLFDIRVAAALRLWRLVSGRDPGPDPGALSPARTRRLILGLRALDGRMQKASYRTIADVIFQTKKLSPDEWRTHSLRDQTIRLVRYGIGMMRGGYRMLLLHPYRRRG